MLLEDLTEASGVSGNESEVRNIIIENIKDYVDNIEIDPIGNIIVYKKGKDIDKTVMVTAHMDEVGLIVSDIDEMGLIKFVTVGGVDKRILVSKPVLIGEDKIPGIIGAKPIHLQTREEWKNAISIDSLYIDIGAISREDAESVVEIGDYITFQSNYIEFGENLVKAKALDNRVGCSLLVDILKEDLDMNFYGVFTVMEEVGLRGAGPAAYKVNPDYSIILEGTLCYEMPELDKHNIPTSINLGPALSLIDKTTIYNQCFRNRIIDLAEDNKIPYQFRKTAMGGNDSGIIHTSKEGSKTATISVPCRYIHSPNSVMSLIDYKNTYRLLKLILLDLKGDFDYEYKF